MPTPGRNPRIVKMMQFCVRSHRPIHCSVLSLAMLRHHMFGPHCHCLHVNPMIMCGAALHVDMSFLQAMIHELVGIKDNTAILTSPKVAEQYR